MEYEQENGAGTEDKNLQLVAFNLGDEEFGVDIMQVQEIIRMQEVTRIPQAPDFVKGVINIRGKIIVVVSLDKCLGLESKETDEHSRIIVVEVGGSVVGMVVDSVSEILSIQESSIEPAPDIIASKINADYLKGVGKLENRLLILLDLEKILTEEQVNQISQLSEQQE
ncbi:CheW protein [Methanohalobium evestigatum Z-7303]|uniref:CheW protein n=1 Tax=Methanohalobium evestigatum (strain ATCC BAA-1072 / DSM 3721 / NBRC 107634 / OCM 161 / Z-7303) TaxID=644295 RepID=D7E8U1_METEZ|nr:chemotaxis protein CheW [Methanohalobium evestigatum]ADI73762.1 CheW protein [Methanohalobium evestigatum Z-7303]